MLKILSEYIYIQLKYHEHRIRRKTSILLENVCYGAKCVHFTLPSGRGDVLFYLTAQMYKFSNTFIKKI